MLLANASHPNRLDPTAKLEATNRRRHGSLNEHIFSENPSTHFDVDILITMAKRSGTSAAHTQTRIATAAKTRRSHRKSRNGCIECKNRHIRCDERRPSCANCEAAERICSFLPPRSTQRKSKAGTKDRAPHQRASKSTVLLAPSHEASSQSNIESMDSADFDPAQQLQPLIVQQGILSDPEQGSEPLSGCLLLTHYSLPYLQSRDGRPHQIPSPASPIELNGASTPPPNCCPGLSAVPSSVPKAVFTPQHLVLLHHARTVPNLVSPGRDALGIAIKHAVDAPYLIDEVLAFTAFHLASIYPGSTTYLRHLATELQTRALTSFTRLTELVPHDDKATAVPRFLFSAILGRHVLADTLTYCCSDFHFFIDRLVECINLNRGIKAVTPPAWEYLANTEIGPFLSLVREAQQRIVSPGNECLPLSRLMDQSDLNDASIRACRQAIEVLQLSFDLCHNLEEDDYLQATSAFSVSLGAGFVDVLRKHRPEALVILAYYGVLLYRCRNFRAFEDAGGLLIRAIAGRLGSYWQEALAWPLHVLEKEGNNQSH